MKFKEKYVAEIHIFFWKEVLIAWNEYNYYKNFNVENQYIWYNSSIKIQGKPFFWKKQYKLGLKYVYQLFNKGQYKTDDQVQMEFNLTVMLYNSLKAAIPQDWKIQLMESSKGVFLPNPPHNYDFVKTKKGLAATVYRYMSDDIINSHNKYQKWTMELGDPLASSLVDYATLFKDIYRITNYPKLRSFQYRLLQRGIVTNVQLHHWKMRPDNLCSFCNSYKETLSHLFSTCDNVKTLWKKLADYIQQRYNITQISLDTTKIITNKVFRPHNHVGNFMFLIGKQYVYRQRCLNEPIQFQALKAQILHIKNIEKYIAIKNDKLRVHRKKMDGVSGRNFQWKISTHSGRVHSAQDGGPFWFSYIFNEILHYIKIWNEFKV